MKTQEWNYYDKSKWPDRGPWDNEPDKMQWTDETTGLPCLIVRNRMGALCGYVGVSEGNPAYGQGYDRVRTNNGEYIDVHGGLTFSNFCQDGVAKDGGPLVCHVPEEGETDKVWWLGFDCLHCGDAYPCIDDRLKEIRDSTDKLFPGVREMDTYRTVPYVKDQCALLAAQLVTAKVPERES